MKITITVDTANNQEVIEALGLLTDLAVKGSAEVKPEPKKPAGRVRPKAEPKAKKEAVETPPETETKPEVEEKKETPPPAGVTLATLKNAAKTASGTAGREKVLEAIKCFAPKLADVKEENYAELEAVLLALA